MWHSAEKKSWIWVKMIQIHLFKRLKPSARDFQFIKLIHGQMQSMYQSIIYATFCLLWCIPDNISESLMSGWDLEFIWFWTKCSSHYSQAYNSYSSTLKDLLILFSSSFFTVIVLFYYLSTLFKSSCNISNKYERNS